MKYKVGDKVKFLNKVGGGFITQVLANGMVKVMVEDGFEYPVMEKELILINPQNSLERYFDEDFDVPVSQRKARSEDYELNQEIERRREVREVEESKEKKLVNNSEGEPVDKGIILAFIPKDQNQLTKGEMSIAVLNYTEYTVMFNFYLKSSLREYTSSGLLQIPPYSKYDLGVGKREDLTRWMKGIFQALFVTAQTKQVPNPIHTEINLKPSYFEIADNYRTSNIINEKAFMIMLNDLFYHEKINVPKDEKNKDVLISEEKAKQSAPVIPSQLIDRHKIDKGKAEVDLHISALRDDYSSMKNSEILAIQKEYFLAALENALTNHYREVIFIHGIGNGVLRDVLIKLLNDQYDDLTYRDAPFQKFGYGAIVVELKV
ncbi:DUF2027 domain-containing protein [Bacteroidales bacterium OttesenSCG-928-K03]|nr:DUF2027 domain-containing protein [Bacteroidales bacterium OttesenSCG-928-K03]